MRQYRIITKTPESDPVMLEPVTHAALYNIPEVREAVSWIAEHDSVEMVGVRVRARFYSIVVSYEEELQEGHFKFDGL